MNTIKPLTITILVYVMISSINSGSSPITEDDINNLRIEIRTAADDSSFTPINEDLESGQQPLIGSIVRLAFHDCVGRNIKQNNGNGADSPSGKLTDNKCNGCFDFNVESNAGLEDNAFNTLEDIYTTSDNEWDSKMSRADFWAASATIALEIAAANQYTILSRIPFARGTQSPLRDIPFYFGREDCTRSPYATEKDVFEYPDSNVGWKDTFAWFQENMGFDERETVTIIGAHTLGAAHADASGFLYNWVPNNINVLNNEYYLILSTFRFNFFAFNSFVQKRVGDLRGCRDGGVFGDICEDENDNLRQWVIGNETALRSGLIGTGIMVNADISLTLKIEDYLDPVTGIVNCTAPTTANVFGAPPANDACPFQDGIIDIVNEFAFDNKGWLNEFADAFEKMILIGEKDGGSKLQKLIVEYDRSVETSPDAAMINGESIGDDLLHKTEDSKDQNINWYYYIGIGVGGIIVISCLMVVFYIIYRYKQKALLLEKQVKECNDASTSHESNDGGDSEIITK